MMIKKSEQCVQRVHTSATFNHTHQCSRKNGYGVDGLYCKQHAEKHLSFKQKETYTWYTYDRWSDIESVEIIRFNDLSVWIAGQGRVNRVSDMITYFPSKEEAYRFAEKK